MTPEQAQQLIARLDKLEQTVNFLVLPNRYLFKRNIELFNGINFIFGVTTGTKLGTSAAQKFGMYGATPKVQAAAISAPTAPGVGYSQAEAASAVAAINAIRNALGATLGIGITA